MSQEGVFLVLKKHKELSAKEIAEILHCRENAVFICLKRMLKNLEVEKIELTREEVKAKGIKKYVGGRHHVWRLKK